MASGFGFDFENDPAHFYVWRPPSDALSIHLSLAVVRRLEQECIRAARTDVQLAGVLLGRAIPAPQPRSIIEDYALLKQFEGTSRTKISYQESLADDLGKLALKARPGRQAVGFFRWQLGGWLTLTASDLDTAKRFFHQPTDVILLIRYSGLRGNEAGFFWHEKGAIPFRDAMVEFPLDIAKLVQPRAPEHRSKPQDPKPGDFPEALALPEASAYAPDSVRWVPLLPTALVAMLLTGAGVVSFSSTPSAAPPQATAPLPIAEQPTLGLSVVSKGDQLMIRWNTRSEVIAGADKGFVRISDSHGTEMAELDVQQLRDGYVAYGPASNDASIHLEVRTRDGGLFTQSVRFLQGVKP